jgi:RNA polymerase sigma factor (sigma-70 family)
VRWNPGVSPVPCPGAEVAESFLFDRAFVAKLVRLARSRFGIDGTDAEDLVQETALEIVCSPSLIANPQGFAFQVFHNRCSRFLERRKRAISTTSPAEGLDSPAVDVSVETGVMLRQGFARISPTCRLLLTSYYLEGTSLRETAARTGHSSKQVWKRLSACLKKLKETIGA